jgi:hypothetical protein
MEVGGMSIHAIDWVLRSTVKPPSDRFVLVVLANYCNSFGLAYPSIRRIAINTGYDRKTVNAALARLRNKGLIHDSGKRVGVTKSIIVYKLSWAVEEDTEEVGPKMEQLQNRNSPVLLPKQAQFSGKQAQSTHQNRQKNRQEPSETIAQSDSQWLVSLKEDNTYAGIDVEREFGKMSQWCKVRKKKATRRRFINWLNGAERPCTPEWRPTGWTEKKEREFQQAERNYGQTTANSENSAAM